MQQGIADEPQGSRAAQDAQEMRNKFDRETEMAKAKLEEGKEQLAHDFSSATSSLKDEAIREAESGKNQAADGLRDFTAAIRKASEELGERDQSMAAGFAREAASGLEHFAGSLKGKNVQELTHSIAGFARKQPAAFLVGAALAGVALGRFAKASGAHGTDEVRPHPAGTETTVTGRPEATAQAEDPVMAGTSVLGTEDLPENATADLSQPGLFQGGNHER
ncbi:hypothetical protein [Limoniibacter endophyticus]|uniref:Nutrient deprivation-induced protein n=1 Tax=Limoniibacter endophyticus TaxID=1565040 RepID=A0A8J3GHI5_9HYPH|nr:hypothetical protein [Limoniibacter endophyticus]GHC72424.1 hypothetical protein GCM10010136_20120 [Limoniibacter endophyticus]